jgi:hypothetical protein
VQAFAASQASELAGFSERHQPRIYQSQTLVGPEKKGHPCYRTGREVLHKAAKELRKLKGKLERTPKAKLKAKPLKSLATATQEPENPKVFLYLRASAPWPSAAEGPVPVRRAIIANRSAFTSLREAITAFACSSCALWFCSKRRD